MEINLINNAKNIDITVNESPEGFTIFIAEKKNNNIILGDVKPGEVVKLGLREYIVLEHSKETTAVITKNFVTYMNFGRIGNYANSNVRAYLNDIFYKELCDAIGKENIIPHVVHNDHNGNFDTKEKVLDNISLITENLYRRYRKLIPLLDVWWTSTGIVTLDKKYSCCVCNAQSRDFLAWFGSDSPRGVRPFCILNSSISIS